MESLGLNDAELKRLHTLLRTPHRKKVHLYVLDLDHNYISTVSDRLMDGSVSIDSTAAITRSMGLTLLDPNRVLAMDSDSPAEGAFFYDRMIKVVVTIATPDQSWWVDIPTFVGPVRKLNRSGAVVQLECQGKEILASGGSWKRKTYKKGARSTSVIRDILRNICGETKLDIPNKTHRIKSNVSVGPSNPPWIAAKKVAAAMGYQLFYDGRGYAVLRRKTAAVVLDYDGSNTTETPKFSYNQDTLINVVQVIGKKPKGAKRRVSYTAYAPTTHPLSGQKLRRGGVNQFKPLVIENNSIGSTAGCKNIAKRELARGLLQSMDATWRGVTYYHLEEDDIVRVATGENVALVRVKKMTIPLLPGDSAFGYLKDIRPNKKAIRRAA